MTAIGAVHLARSLRWRRSPCWLLPAGRRARSALPRHEPGLGRDDSAAQPGREPRQRLGHRLQPHRVRVGRRQRHRAFDALRRQRRAADRWSSRSPLPTRPAGRDPTGIVFSGGDRLLRDSGASGRARFIFATEEGTIAGVGARTSNTTHAQSSPATRCAARSSRAWRSPSRARATGSTPPTSTTAASTSSTATSSPITLAGGFIDPDHPRAASRPSASRPSTATSSSPTPCRMPTGADEVQAARAWASSMSSTPTATCSRGSRPRGVLNAPWGIAAGARTTSATTATSCSSATSAMAASTRSVASTTRRDHLVISSGRTVSLCHVRRSAAGGPWAVASTASGEWRSATASTTSPQHALLRRGARRGAPRSVRPHRLRPSIETRLGPCSRAGPVWGPPAGPRLRPPILSNARAPGSAGEAVTPRTVFPRRT